MYQARDTDNLITKPIELSVNGNLNYKSNLTSKMTYLTYFLISCLVLFTTTSLIFNQNGEKVDLTLVAPEPTIKIAAKETIQPPQPPLVSNASHPFCFKTGGKISQTKSSVIQTTISSIKSIFYSLLPTNKFTLSDILGQSIRLAFHDAAEIDLTNTDDMMGPDGCISDTNPNFGLTNATSYVNILFDPIWQDYCDVISRGDFWALVGKLSVEIADPTKTINIPYYYGRVDKSSCYLPNNNAQLYRPPNALSGLNTLATGFIDRMGLSINDIGDGMIFYYTTGDVSVNTK